LAANSFSIFARRSDGRTITPFAASFFSYFRERPHADRLRTQEAVASRHVGQQLFPHKSALAVLPPSNATIQRMGRMKRGPSKPVQVMERGQAKSWTARGRMSARICSGGAATTDLLGRQVLALGRRDHEHFLRATPCFRRRKLAAARVASPTESSPTTIPSDCLSLRAMEKLRAANGPPRSLPLYCSLLEVKASSTARYAV